MLNPKKNCKKFTVFKKKLIYTYKFNKKNTQCVKNKKLDGVSPDDNRSAI